MGKTLLTAMLFAGQGPQFVGMGQDLYNSSEEAKQVFNKANEVLGFDIIKLCFEGPKEDLDQTINTQPAVFTYNMAVYYAVGQPKPDFFAGHSLGEVCAVVASGSISLETGFKMIQKRAQFMQHTAEKNNGSMIAPIGLTADDIAKAIDNIDDTYIANYNSEAQTTVSGTQTALQTASSVLTEAGAKKVVNLAVSGAFHSPFMQEAADNFAKYLDEIYFKDADVPVIANVDAQPKQSSEEIKLALSKQISAPVQFVKMLEFLNNHNVDTYAEIGPGKVLSNLVKRAYPEANIFTADNLDNSLSLEGEG